MKANGDTFTELCGKEPNSAWRGQGKFKPRLVTSRYNTASLLTRQGPVSTSYREEQPACFRRGAQTSAHSGIAWGSEGRAVQPAPLLALISPTPSPSHFLPLFPPSLASALAPARAHFAEI